MRSVQNNNFYRAAGGRAVFAMRRRGFTLVEVMVAIAISLALIIGISEIFAIAQQTTGAGTTLSAINDVNRSFQTTLNSDMRSIVTSDTDCPGLIIDSYALPAFRSKADAQNSPDQTDPTIFPPPFDQAGSNYSFSQAFSVNDRIHRTDRLCYFVRGSFTRQTGESPNLSSPTKSNEAYVSLGHLAIPNDTTINEWDWSQPANGGKGFFNPGATIGPTGNSGKNDNNYYASSWILGRSVMLLAQDPTQNSPATPLLDSGFQASSTNPPPLFLSLPTIGPATCIDGTSTYAPLCANRYDVAYVTMASWYKYISTPGSPRPGANWWQYMSGTRLSGTGIDSDQRFYANPYPTKKTTLPVGQVSNWISAAVAQTAPIFVRNCSQFIVEFAGDYCTQDIDGNPIAGKGPDGQIDFVVEPVTFNHRIRWYGFPRDTAGLNTNSLELDGNVDRADVMPVSMFMGLATPLDFERTIPNGIAKGMTKLPFANTAGGNVPKSSEPYICAWGPDVTSAKPKMLRITIGIDNPNGRLNTQQMYEYVFTLPS